MKEVSDPNLMFINVHPLWEHFSSLIMEIERKSACLIKFIKHSENEYIIKTSQLGIVWGRWVCS